MPELRDDLRFALDPVAFAEAVGIEPDPWQARLLRSKAKRVLLNCSRQSGKTSTTAILSLHTALYEPGSMILVLGPAERQAKEFFKRVSDFYRTLGHKVPADSDRKLGMELSNGSRIEALPGAEKTIRGFSGVDLLVLDEAARVDDGLYYAVRPMLAVSGGRLAMLSTPFGKRGCSTRSGRTARVGSATRSPRPSARAFPRRTSTRSASAAGATSRKSLCAPSRRPTMRCSPTRR